jgi:sterol desaturase/sphingolipid hydroxylase (fatty acid hydroxylase superfamily)
MYFSISKKSIKNFTIVNSTLILIGLFHYFCNCIFDSIFIIYLLNVGKNYLLLSIINESVKDKELLCINNIPKENYNYEFDINIFTSSIVETGTSLYINNYIIQINNSEFKIFLFIPLSFIYELTFDFFHYWMHRISHENKYLYKYLHKKHHKYNNINSCITYYQSPFDLILTNSLPQIMSLLIFPYFSRLEYEIINIYLKYQEISGHNGHKTYPTSCFGQCIWLPRILNIELYSEDHYLHHSLNNCNYAKRFSLWDKLFNTYKTMKDTQ